MLNAAERDDLFFASVMPLEAADAFALLAHDTDIWLLAAGTVFAVDADGGFKVAGACNEVSDARGASHTTVHLFDGRSLLPPELPQDPARAPNRGSITISLEPKSQTPT